MKRELSKFSEKIYDIAIVGGGIYGACMAWEATLRGLKVALVGYNPTTYFLKSCLLITRFIPFKYDISL